MEKGDEARGGLAHSRAALAYPPALRAEVLATALREREPDLVVRNCRVLAVHSGEWVNTNLVISAGRIAAWDAQIAGGRQTVDAEGRWAIPGLMDGHMHVEATMLTIGELARLLVPRGVTAILADLHEIANVFGRSGVGALVAEAADVPLRVFLQVPAVLEEAVGRRMLRSKAAVSFGEASLARINRDRAKFMNLYSDAHGAGRVITGHAAGLAAGPELSALAAVGQGDDHECVTSDQAWDRLRMGQRVMIREGSAARDLRQLVRVVTERPDLADRFLFCTDDRHVNDILARGHVDDCVRTAVAEGVAPEVAIRMATLSCAAHHRLDADLGSLAPGRLADLVLVGEPKTVVADMVFVGGELVARKGEALWEASAPHVFPKRFYRSVRIGRTLTPHDLQIPAPGELIARARVIEITPGQILKRLSTEQVAVQDGGVATMPERDILKIAVVERHRGSGAVGVGLVRGFGLRWGAMASSVAHDEHNIVAVGATDGEILTAIKAVEEAQGGLAVVERRAVLALVPLPVAGLLSQERAGVVARQVEAAESAARGLGCTMPAPFMALSFVPLSGLPEVALSEHGLFETAGRKPLTVVVP